MTEMSGRVPERVEIGVQVIRADGSVDDLGIVASTTWHWYSPARWRAWFRTQTINRRRGL